MKTRKSLLAAVAASLTVLAGGEARAQATTTTTTTTTAAVKPWAFSTGSARPQIRAVSAARATKAMGFNMTTTAVGPARVRRMSFAVTGTLQKSDVANYQLVFYPAGPTAPGVVLGSATGATWAPTKTASIVNIDLVSPFDVSGSFSGLFELRVDVNGTRSFDFQPQLQTVTIESGGVTKYVVDTEDLPLLGDELVVSR